MGGQVGLRVHFLLHHSINLLTRRLTFFSFQFGLQPLAAPAPPSHREPARVSGGVSAGLTAPPPGAGHAQNDSSRQEEAGREEGDTKSATRLVFAALRQVCSQEVADDLVGEPGRRNQAEDTGQDEARPRSHRCVPLRSAAAPPSGTFKPQGGETESEQPQNTAHNHGGPCGLQRGRQRQHRGLHCAAKDAGGVPHAVHPQTLHLRHGGHETGPSADAHLPVGQQCGHGAPQNSEESQGKCQNLDCRGQHRSAGSEAAAAEAAAAEAEAVVSCSGPDSK